MSWVRLFPEDLLGGITQMDCREVGQYILMLVAQWCAERSAERSAVRDAPGALKSILRGEELSPSVRAKFERFDLDGCAYLRNQRMSKEIAHSQEEYETRRKGAERSAERSAERTPEGALSVPKPQPQPQPRTKNQEPTDNGLPAAPQPAALVPVVKPRKESWSRDACDVWIERFGGTAPGGQVGKALKPLVDQHGWEEVRDSWRSYLAQTEAEYASPSRFASTYGNWVSATGPAPPGAPPRGKPTKDSRNFAVLNEFFGRAE
jgi:uncharacterized protein YdaU (DUF1376 family)